MAVAEATEVAALLQVTTEVAARVAVALLVAITVEAAAPAALVRLARKAAAALPKVEETK